MTTQIDPCAEAERLRALRTAIIAGDAVSMTRFGDEEVRFYKADLTRLEALIAQYETSCALSKGETPKRNRFAARIRFTS